VYTKQLHTLIYSFPKNKLQGRSGKFFTLMFSQKEFKRRVPDKLNTLNKNEGDPTRENFT
jgi:hypothetical protein